MLPSDDRGMRQPPTDLGHHARNHSEQRSPRRIGEPADQDVPLLDPPEVPNPLHHPSRPSRNAWATSDTPQYAGSYLQSFDARERSRDWPGLEQPDPVTFERELDVLRTAKLIRDSPPQLHHRSDLALIQAEPFALPERDLTDHDPHLVGR